MIEDKKGKKWPVMTDENVGIYFLGMGDWHGHVPKTPQASRHLLLEGVAAWSRSWR
jgi:hypothetical protein